ncbi:putative peroxisomal biogenesis AAA ATPase pex1 [Mycena kentingensis (nom. inval.)]|nr:putative peroxisomal biogenesis AAA ATPase pex1 [Mycena kentingensis (nom. inval.)]
MPRRARLHLVSLKSSLVNLPLSLYGPLVERSVRPQHLAVHLTLLNPQKSEVYVGWTGMASASSLAQFNASDAADRALETVEIDPQYALSLGLKQNDLVEIALIHDLPAAAAVETEPLTADDWEIIEIHASHVESTLLSQVRVVQIGQEIDVWVLGRTRVRLRVVSTTPQPKGSALLLTTNTEVSISPKLHNQTRPFARNPPNGTLPPTNETSEPTPTISTPKLRVIRPDLLPIPFPDYAGTEVLALIPPATFALLHPTTSLPNVEYQRAAIKRLPSPVDPLSTTSSSETPARRVLHAGGTDLSTKETDITELYVRAAEGVPDGHVVLLPVNGIEEWDLVRLLRPTESSKIHEKTSKLPSPRTTPHSSTLAGVDDILNRCSQFCTRKFSMHSAADTVHGVSSLLLTGRSGSGKTSIVRAVTAKLQNSGTRSFTLYIDVSRFSTQPLPVVKALLAFWLEKAAWHRPSVLVLDNLEKLVGVEVEHTDSFRTRQIAEIFITLFSSSARATHLNTRGVILIATAASPAALHPRLKRAHIFEESLSIPSPNKNARKEGSTLSPRLFVFYLHISQIILRMVQERLGTARDLQLDLASSPNYAAIASQTEGYSAVDLQDLVARAIHQVAMRALADGGPPLLSRQDFELAQVDFVPLSLRETKLQKSETSWADIGGLEETRKILRETLEWPTKYGPIFAQSPLRLRSGLLLYGYPGCGKTLLASAVAKECGLNFISVKGPEILNKYIGASEQSVRDLFERASAAKPCVLFFDEFDSIAPKRGHDSTGVTDRVVNQMLTQMDGAEGLDGVYVLAATSRPDLIDSALLRPGRLDKSLLCDMPNADDRKDILRAVSRKVQLSPDINLDEIASATEGFSGADLQALVYNAHLEAVNSSLSRSDVPTTVSSQPEEASMEFKVIGGAQRRVTSKADDMALQRRLRQIMSPQRKPDASKQAFATSKTASSAFYAQLDSEDIAAP